MQSRARPEETAKAWRLLEEFNSRMHIEAVRKAAAATTEQVLLLSAVLEGVVVVVAPPTLLADTVEETLHMLDSQTPDNLIYDDLLPRNLTIELQSAEVRLRDFVHPMLSIPGAPGRARTWRTTGLLVVAEPAMPTESRRVVVLPLPGAGVDSIIVTRSVSPTKIYLRTKTVVNCSPAIRVVYGAPLEPTLADMVSIIDSFTKANVDPSPPVGWWDKMRLMLHGENSIKVSGSGEIIMRVLGSTSPYYDPLKHFGMGGVELALASGVNVQLGGQKSDDLAVLEAGEVRLSVPQGDTSGHDYAQRKDDLLAKLTGGVRIAIGVIFMTMTGESARAAAETPPWKTHNDIVLRSPEYCHATTLGQPWDSFYGFRSSSLHVRVQITSPRPFFSGLSAPNNYLCLNSLSLQQLQILAMVYQSILTNVPVRTRAMIAKPAASGAGQRPKLGRMIGTVRIIALLQPLMLSFITENDDLTGGVGLRARAARMDSDIFLRQHRVRDVDESASRISRRPVYRWDLEESQLSFVDIEGCTMTYGRTLDPTGEPLRPSTLGLEADDDLDQLVDVDEWILAEDVYYSDDFSSFRFSPFLWSPKLIYFRRSASGVGQAQREKDIYLEQMELLKIRLREIEATIWSLKEDQRELESRKAIFFDATMAKDSAALVDRLTVMYEKRALIQSSIRELGDAFDAADKVSLDRDSDGQRNDQRVFKHHYVIHNMCFMWNVPVRNAIFRLVDAQTKIFAYKYCLSNAASKVVSELVQIVANQRVKSLSDGAGARNVPELDAAALPDSVAGSSSDLTAQLLDQLLNDVALGIRVHVHSDGDSDHDQVRAPPPERPAHAGRFRKVSKYEPSSDPLSPDYVAHGEVVEGEMVLTLINPQVALEVASPTDPSTVQSLIVASTTMELFSVMILDESAAAAREGYDDKDRNDAIIKYRTIMKLHEAQIFAQQSVDLAFPFSARGADLGGSSADVFSASITSWVPVECFLDTNSSDPRFVRIVDQTSASFYRDKLNPLYFARTSRAPVQQQADTHHVFLPQFRISITSAQYLLVHQVISSLLVYKDPAKGKRTERLRKMMLALEQLQDLTQLQDMVLTLQDKVRQLESMLRVASSSSSSSAASDTTATHPSPGPSPTPPLKSATAAARQHNNDVRQSLTQGLDELYVLMEALKGMQLIEKHRKSEGVALQFNLTMDKFVWLMLLDSGDPLLRWTFTNTSVVWTHKEDQSSSNILEIDMMHVENLLQTSTGSFRDVIAPYIPDDRIVNFRTNKMLRLQLRELPPVAGIQVIDHFEVGIFPLSIQLTYEIYKHLTRYVFPNKKVTELRQMQVRASENRSFIYIKIPGAPHCLSYHGHKEKNLEDINMFEFKMPNLEYRNRTWTWYELFSAIKKDAIYAAAANTGALMRKKIFEKRKAVGPSMSSIEEGTALHATIDDTASVFAESGLAVAGPLRKTLPAADADDGRGRRREKGGILRGILKRKDKRDDDDDDDDEIDGVPSATGPAVAGAGQHMLLRHASREDLASLAGHLADDDSSLSDLAAPGSSLPIPLVLPAGSTPIPPLGATVGQQLHDDVMVAKYRLVFGKLF
nr:hypothetical protein HK105_003574 [Polyrhizophydium stewartii]